MRDHSPRRRVRRRVQAALDEGKNRRGRKNRKEAHEGIGMVETPDFIANTLSDSRPTDSMRHQVGGLTRCDAVCRFGVLK